MSITLYSCHFQLYIIANMSVCCQTALADSLELQVSQNIIKVPEIPIALTEDSLLPSSFSDNSGDRDLFSWNGTLNEPSRIEMPIVCLTMGV